jgi:thiol-disulfide isomerase/thioredoxin/outer membrane lipoprotein-sorting protein
MRWIVRLLLFAAIATFQPVTSVAAAATDDSPSAAKLLDDAKQRYTDAKYYHVEMTEEQTSKGEYSRSWNKTVTTAIMAPENRYRFEVRKTRAWWTQVSDGHSEWIYRPGVQEYTKQDTPAAGPTEFPDPTSPSSSSTPRDAIFYEEGALTTAQKTMKTLLASLSRMGSPVYVRDETLVLDDKEVPCFVIEALRGTNQQLLWIDKKTHLVRRLETHNGIAGSSNMPDEAMVFDTSQTFNVMNLDPLSESGNLFALTLPEKAKLVTKFENHSYSFNGKDLAGTVAPSLTLHAADGSSVSLASFRGKPVLIDFWATWCGPCMKALPSTEKLYQEMADKGIVMLSVDEDREADKAKEFWAKHKEPWPDFHDDNWETEHALGSSAIPYFVLIDPSGKITFTHTGGGEATESLLRGAISKLGPQFASLAGDTKTAVVEKQQTASEKPVPQEMPAIK